MDPLSYNKYFGLDMFYKPIPIRLVLNFINYRKEKLESLGSPLTEKNSRLFKFTLDNIQDYLIQRANDTPLGRLSPLPEIILPLSSSNDQYAELQRELRDIYSAVKLNSGQDGYGLRLVASVYAIIDELYWNSQKTIEDKNMKPFPTLTIETAHRIAQRFRDLLASDSECDVVFTETILFVTEDYYDLQQK